MQSLARLKLQTTTCPSRVNYERGKGSTRSPFFMQEPKMRKVMHEGVLQWEITYAGVTRYHRQDWQAQWLFSYFMRLKNCGLEPAHAPDAP